MDFVMFQEQIGLDAKSAARKKKQKKATEEQQQTPSNPQ
jgi:hypothetical protein